MLNVFINSHLQLVSSEFLGLGTVSCLDSLQYNKTRWYFARDSKNACKIQRKAQHECIVLKNSWLGDPVEFLILLFSSFVGELFSFHVTAYYQIILTN